jgi:hypothetical protein
MSRKKLKRAVKKVSSVGVRRVPSAFDDDSLKGVFLWPPFNFRDNCPSGSENEFVDVDSFSDAAPEVQKEPFLPLLRSPLLMLMSLPPLSPPLLPKLLLLKSLLLTEPPPNSPRTLSSLFKGETILPNTFLWLKFGRLSPKIRLLLLP